MAAPGFDGVDRQVASGIEDGPHAGSHNRMIINNDDSDHLRVCTFHARSMTLHDNPIMAQI